MNKVIIIIPARWGSTRLPGKPLITILNKPMIQWVYEECKKSDADEVYPAYHANYDWDYDSVEEYDELKFAHFSNLHQATFIINAEHLYKIGKQFDFTKFFGKSNYSKKCKVNTDIYQFCGMKKVICISEFEENLIHHLPNLYINGDLGRNKNQRSDDSKMKVSLAKLNKL